MARRAAAALAAGSLLGAVALVEPAAAQASPLDPGLDSIGASFTVTNCSAPQAIVGQPYQSRVNCGVGAHQFVVPDGVSSLRVDVRGAAGGSGGGGAPGGAGERIRTSIFVWPGEVLEMAVGGRGDNHEHGGFNGGGDGTRPGATGVTASGGGGGSSDVRIGVTGPWSRIISAAGGGGGGGSSSDHRYAGGAGGRNALAGEHAPGELGGRPGLPATWTGSGAGGAAGAGGSSSGSGAAGGAIGGAPGSTKTLIGGTGGIGVQASPSAGDGGAGGGGYGFGGGGAGGVDGTVESRAAAGGGGGGGGGSSYVNPDWVRFHQQVLHTPGFTHGNGSISIVYNAPPLRCGQTIYASMTLTTDLHCNGGDPLIIGGLAQQTRNTGIVFDLGGHTISGGNEDTGIELQQDGITVRNGTLRGFGTGISSPGLSGYAGLGAEDLLTLTNLTITGGTVGVSIDGGFGLAARIDHTVISGMSSAGISAGGQGGGSLAVTNSTIRNSGAGVDSAEIFAVKLANDVVTGNTGSGIGVIATKVTLAHNSVLGNGSGIGVQSPSGADSSQPVLPTGSVTITGNTVRGNAGDGLAVIGRVGAGSVLTNNHATGNGFAPASGAPGDGILVQLDEESSFLTLTANGARDNAGWGIDALAVIDGGANRASGNAAGQDCRGVLCTVS